MKHYEEKDRIIKEIEQEKDRVIKEIDNYNSKIKGKRCLICGKKINIFNRLCKGSTICEACYKHEEDDYPSVVYHIQDSTINKIFKVEYGLELFLKDYLEYLSAAKNLIIGEKVFQIIDDILEINNVVSMKINYLGIYIKYIDETCEERTLNYYFKERYKLRELDSPYKEGLYVIIIIYLKAILKYDLTVYMNPFRDCHISVKKNVLEMNEKYSWF